MSDQISEEASDNEQRMLDALLIIDRSTCPEDWGFRPGGLFARAIEAPVYAPGIYPHGVCSVSGAFLADWGECLPAAQSERLGSLAGKLIASASGSGEISAAKSNEVAQWALCEALPVYLQILGDATAADIIRHAAYKKKTNRKNGNAVFNDQVTELFDSAWKPNADHINRAISRLGLRVYGNAKTGVWRPKWSSQLCAATNIQYLRTTFVELQAIAAYRMREGEDFFANPLFVGLQKTMDDLFNCLCHPWRWNI